MAKQVEILLLWHMHQPDYRDHEGKFFMPWVFLHAIKDYYDMPYLHLKYNVKATFNLTPILLEQLQYYIDRGLECDRFLSLLAKPPSQLLEQDRSFVVKMCKTIHIDTMAATLKPLHRLYYKSDLNDEEINDLEVWFLLAWCGNYLRSTNEVVRNLSKKSAFSHEDKLVLLDELFSFLPLIIPLYKKLQDSGKISVTTTPYSHPILPLLLDMQNAKSANPQIQLPHNPLSLEEDAKLHIQKAIDIYKSFFNKKPEAFWPAEGAVDEKSLRLYKKFGIKIVATDEIVLKKSGYYDPYKFYSFEGLKIVFRDHTISDQIGFSYKNLPTKEAISDFVSRLPKKGVTTIILDGENAWEYYPNGGSEFLNAFYTTLERFKTYRIDEISKKPSINLHHLEPGSWIYGNFDTWVGDEEKNRAWEMLYQTKRDTQHHTQTPIIVQHFLHAEASDWFWWYGYGHYTEFAQEFDWLFRNHLIQIYRLLDLEPPQDLFIPIVGSHEIKAVLNQPTNYIYPVIDGKVTSFFEWLGSGYIDERTGGTMQINPVVERLLWGENENSLFFRLDSKEAKEIDIKLFFDETQIEPTDIAKEEIVEIAVEKSKLTKKEYEVRIEILKKGHVVQIVPGVTRLIIKIDWDYSANWFV